MKTSSKGIALIKEFEGCSLKAYKDSVGVVTIGWGTTNADKDVTGRTITMGLTISQATADKWLQNTLTKRYEPKVRKYDAKYNWNQNEFDALVSFAYNIGSIDALTANGSRTKKTIAEKMLLYVKAGGKTLKGLQRRRIAEHDLFCTPAKEYYSGKYPKLPKRGYFKDGDGIRTLVSYQTHIKRVQRIANWVLDADLKRDGIYGPKTEAAVRRIQKRFKLPVNGCYGKLCQAAIKDYKK